MSTSLIWVNGVPSHSLSASDRGLLYGHSVFETIHVVQGKARLKELHLDRLTTACERLSIPIEISRVADELERFCEPIEQGVVRLTVTIGEGGRGYASPDHAEPTRVLSLHELPEVARRSSNWEKGVAVGVSDIRLSTQPSLAGIKHGNRLEQILIRNGWQAGWQEALVFDQAEHLIEATQANVFLRHGDSISTPTLDTAGVAGVMRQFVLQNLDQSEYNTTQTRIGVAEIATADEIVLTNSVIGAWPIREILANSLLESKTFEPNEFKLSTAIIRLLKQL